MKVVLLITHFYLPLLPMIANKHYPKTYAPWKKKYCPLQASTLLQRSSDSCFLCLSICFPQMHNTGHTFPGSNQSVRQLPHPPRTSWLLCIGHFIVRSLDFILCILPCRCHKEAVWHSRNTSSFGVKSRLLYPLMAVWPWVVYLTILNSFCLFVYLKKYRCILLIGL